MPLCAYIYIYVPPFLKGLIEDIEVIQGKYAPILFAEH